MKWKKLFPWVDGLAQIIVGVVIIKLFIFMLVSSVIMWWYLVSLPEFSHLADEVAIIMKWISVFLIILILGLIYFISKFIMNVVLKETK